MPAPSEALALQVQQVLATNADTELTPEECQFLVVLVENEALSAALHSAATDTAPPAELRRAADAALSEFEQVLRRLPEASGGRGDAESAGLAALVAALAARRRCAGAARAAVEAARPPEGRAQLTHSLAGSRCATPATYPSASCFPGGSLCCCPARTHRAGQAGRAAASLL